MLDQAVEFSCVSSFPWGNSETMDDTCVDIDADMEFYAVSSASSSFDSYLVPSASVMSTESTAVNGDVHSFPSEDAGYSVHDPTDVFDGEFVHISVYDAMTWQLRVVFSEGFAVVDVCFDAVVGEVESFFQDAADCDSLWFVSWSSFVVGFPGWWEPMYCFDNCSGKQFVEVTVDVVRNCWIHSFFSTSHPIKKNTLSLIIYFGMKPSKLGA
jgi:hypothetical protein